MAETEKKLIDSQNPSSPPAKSGKSSSNFKPSITSISSTAFTFWFFFTLSVSLITLFFISLPRINLSDERSYFLTLPNSLRSHYSSGRLIKVNPNPNPNPKGEPMQIFAVDFGNKNAETVLLLHGIGCSSYSFRHLLRLLAAGGFRAVAVDLPGSGFSDEVGSVGNVNWIWSLFSEIKEKGIFWGFDQLIETGEIKEKPARVSAGEGFEYAVIEQVIDSMALAPVHLVLHDSALFAGANLVLANKGLVSSLTIIDASPKSAAFPSFGRFFLRSRILFVWLLRLCCARSVDRVDAEAYRLLLKRKNAVLADWMGLNHSFDVGEWANSEEIEGLPVQLLWSNSLSDQWIDEGRRIAASIPRAKFSFHSGGRWPQEDAAEEVSEMIANFVSSLPKSNRRIEEDTDPNHIQKTFEEGRHQDQHHYHDHHHHGHDQDHELGYMGMYGLGHGW